MRKILSLFGIMAVAALLSANAHAVGLGFYLEGGTGSGNMTEYYDFVMEQPEIDIDVSSAGLGFALDTLPIGERIFAYRLHAGLDSMTIEDEAGQELRMGGLVFDNIFAFGGMVAPTVKFWGGPSVRIGFYSGELENKVDPYLKEYEASGVTFGIGLSAGANIAVGRTVTLCPTLGWKSMGFAGIFEYTWDDGMTREDGSGDIEADWGMFLFSFDMLFR